jgi:PAS domain-containing protein
VIEEVEKSLLDKDLEEFSREYRILTGYGETRWVDDRTFVRRNSKGIVTHYQGIILDVTHRRDEI